MNVTEFKALLKPVTDLVSSGALDASLADELNRRFPPGGDTFEAIEKACHEAIAAGWMCANGEPGTPLGPCDRTRSGNGRPQRRRSRPDRPGGRASHSSRRRSLHGHADHTGCPI